MNGTLRDTEMGSCPPDRDFFPSTALFHHRNRGVYEAKSFIDIRRWTWQWMRIVGRIWGIGMVRRSKWKLCCARLWVIHGINVFHMSELVVVCVWWMLWLLCERGDDFVDVFSLCFPFILWKQAYVIWEGCWKVEKVSSNFAINFASHACCRRKEVKNENRSFFLFLLKFIPRCRPIFLVAACPGHLGEIEHPTLNPPTYFSPPGNPSVKTENKHILSALFQRESHLVFQI